MHTPFPIPGGWSAQGVQLAGRQFELLLPANPDQVLTEQLESEADGRQEAADPYWAALWSSATPTAEFVLGHAWPAETRAIELGCGVGLVGLAAAAVGVDIVLSDYVAEALQIAGENLRRNGLQAGSLLLDWSQAVPPAHQHLYSAVLASDVLYSRDNHVPLLSTIDQLLGAPRHLLDRRPGTLQLA